MERDASLSAILSLVSPWPIREGCPMIDMRLSRYRSFPRSRYPTRSTHSEATEPITWRGETNGRVRRSVGRFAPHRAACASVRLVQPRCLLRFVRIRRALVTCSLRRCEVKARGGYEPRFVSARERSTQRQFWSSLVCMWSMRDRNFSRRPYPDPRNRFSLMTADLSRATCRVTRQCVAFLYRTFIS